MSAETFFTKSGDTWSIRGRLVNPDTCQGISGAGVEAWDDDSVRIGGVSRNIVGNPDDLLGTRVVTDASGYFTITFQTSAFRRAGLDSIITEGRNPDIYFKIFNGNTPIHITKPIRNIAPGAEAVFSAESSEESPEVIVTIPACHEVAENLIPCAEPVAQVGSSELLVHMGLGAMGPAAALIPGFAYAECE